MVTLRAITVENFDAILGLQVGVDQRELVCSNAESIAQAYVQPECIPLAIYAALLCTVWTATTMSGGCIGSWWRRRTRGAVMDELLFRSSWSWYRQTGADTGCIWASI